MTTANLTRDETAARAAVIHVDTIAVELDLREAQRTEGETFPTTATLTFTSTADATWIDFLGASVDEVVVNGVAQPVEWDGARIAVSGLVAHNVVTVRGHGRYSTSGEGLHRFRDPVDGETYLYTQYEPADCRRVYPCFEQPDLKARWTFTVSAPAGWQVLSNGAEASREDIDGGVRVSFAETLPLSSYITAVAAGPYALSLIQTDPRPHRFTVGVFGLRNGNLVLRDALEADIAAERTGLPIARERRRSRGRGRPDRAERRRSDVREGATGCRVDGCRGSRVLHNRRSARSGGRVGGAVGCHS